MDSLHGGTIPGGPQFPEGPQRAMRTPNIGSSKLAKLAGEPSPTSGVAPSKVKAEYADRSGGAHRLGQARTGSNEHVQFREANDVRMLDNETKLGDGRTKFGQTERDMKRYGTLNEAASSMIMRGENSTFDSGEGRWVSITSTKDYANIKPNESERMEANFGLTDSVRTSAEELKSILKECGFEPHKTGFIHKETGMQVAILYNKDEKELSIAIRGLGSSIKETGIFSRAGQVIKDSLGGRTQSTKLCIELGQKLAKFNDSLGGKMGFTLSGHSHGGNLAQIVGTTAGVRTICFNSRAVSADAQNQMKKALGDRYEGNTQNITHFNKRGCWVTDNPALSAMTKFIAKAKSTTCAQRLGTQYYVPSEKKGTIARHNDMKWPVGLEPFAKPKPKSELSHSQNLDPAALADQLHWDVKNEDNLQY